jgi:uncharacterized protein
MAAASGVLAVWSVAWAGNERNHLFNFKPSYLFWGIISAVILYFIFWIGNICSTYLFSFATGQINAVYANKSQLPIWQIAFLLLFWIGPGEEVFWRGMVQRIFSKYFGVNAGWILGALIYSTIHLWSQNFILVMAALVGGLYWGWLFKRFGSLWPGIISHSLWDILVFIILPLK